MRRDAELDRAIVTKFRGREEFRIAFGHPRRVGGGCVLQHQVVRIFVEEDGSAVEHQLAPLRLAVGDRNRTGSPAEIDAGNPAPLRAQRVRDVFGVPHDIKCKSIRRTSVEDRSSA